jgi:hypothetical protein
LKDGKDREIYLVAPPLWPVLSGESTFSWRLLILGVNRQGTAFLWPIRLPGPDGKLDDWSKTAMDAAEQARDRWLRLSADMALGGYRFEVATGKLPDPEWPADHTFQDIIKIAFRNTLISDGNHPVLQHLRGEV